MHALFEAGTRLAAPSKSYSRTAAVQLAIVRQGPRLLLGRKKRGFGEGYVNGFGGKVRALGCGVRFARARPCACLRFHAALQLCGGYHSGDCPEAASTASTLGCAAARTVDNTPPALHIGAGQVEPGETIEAAAAREVGSLQPEHLRRRPHPARPPPHCCWQRGPAGPTGLRQISQPRTQQPSCTAAHRR